MNRPLIKTKIVATVGPASETPVLLKELIMAGANVFRLNLSHGEFEEHAETAARIRAAAKQAGAHVAIMADTRGIEIRTGKLKAGPITLKAGETITLIANGEADSPGAIPVSYPGLVNELKIGSPVLLDDGAIELVVTDLSKDQIKCRVIYGGELGNRKSINLPETLLSISATSPEFHKRQEQEIAFAVENEIDYIAASFVQTGTEIETLRAMLSGSSRQIPLIAKIENRRGVENLDEIVNAADGIMVARGDLGVELPLADVPSTQKKIIRSTVLKGKPVITATQMLASMEHNPRPTRAEASDVANAILDGTSAVMLSGETAVGKYPVEAVETMARIASRAEASLREYGYLQTLELSPAARIADAIGQSARRMAEQLQARAIITLTETGFTARLISKHRPDCPIIAVTESEHVARRLALNWGVMPVLYTGQDQLSDESLSQFACSWALQQGHVEKGDIVLITHGTQQGAGGTDIIRVLKTDALLD